MPISYVTSGQETPESIRKQHDMAFACDLRTRQPPLSLICRNSAVSAQLLILFESQSRPLSHERDSGICVPGSSEGVNETCH